MSKSFKEIAIEKEILKTLNGKPRQIAEYIFLDEEIAAMQNYANFVSIKRLGYNDHGPVHMRMAALNAIKVFNLMHNAGIPFSLEKEGLGTYEDSLACVVIASLLHDLGMTIARDKHEFMSVILAKPIVERILEQFIIDSYDKRIILRSMVLEGILGHMATTSIHSLEAGLVLIGDGCDMEYGRARIPAMLFQSAKVGDIHRYSSSAIKGVEIVEGSQKPVAIKVEMKESVGFFQIEEVLMPKIQSSPVQPYIELYAGIEGKEKLRYL